MDTVKFLAPIASRACHLEETDPQSKGEFFHTLCICGGLDDDSVQLLFEHIISDLSDSELLSSCEFHEGLGDTLSAQVVIELLIGSHLPDDQEKFAQALISLYGGGCLKPDRCEWRLIRSNMSALDFRKLLAQMMEQTCDKVHSIGEFLSLIFSEEDFEFAETLRLVLESQWILDILPPRRKAARHSLYENFVKPFRFSKKIVDDFCLDFLRLGPKEEKAGTVSDRSVSSSSDSDIESKGSLDEFVVDSDDEESEEEVSSESDEESEFSDEDSPRRRKPLKKKLKKRPRASSSSS